MTAVREERRLVTSMFVDVVGSTEMTMRLGAERLKRELEREFTEIARIVADHGGTVEKYVGDAIYALFGAPVAHEDDPMRALRAAEAIRERTRPAAGQPFAVRIGVETGEAVIDLRASETTRQQMSVGAVVNIAARLQQRAEPGEILVGPTARDATASAAEFEDAGEADLKGVGGLRVSRLLRVGASRARVLPFVGRDAELALLAHAFDRMRKGRSVLAVVSGPPGQGKTRLVQEFLRRHEEGTRVIATRCRPADEVGVFAPVRDILGVTTLDELAEQVGRLCTDDTECERVVAGLAESAGIAASRSLGALGAAEREDEIVQAWRRYLALVGGDALVILAIDDIHWADTSLVRLVDRITFGGPRVLVVATARPEFADAAGIRPSGDRFFIELEGLDADEAHRLAALAGHDDTNVVARAEGNPLFIVELARAGQDGTDLPITLQGALGARLDQLQPDDRALISLAAVAGERFTAADAAFLSGRDVGDAGRALGRMVDLHFLDLGEHGYRFHHGLVRDVAYGRLLSAERMRAHARFAKERVNPEYPEALAYHWWEALKPPDAEWVWSGDPDLAAMRREAYAAHLAAGSRHGEHFAIDQAAELLGRASQLASDDAERAAVERALGNAFRRVLRTDDAWAHLIRARELLDARAPADLFAELLMTAQYVGAFHRPPSAEEVSRIAEEGAVLARTRGEDGALSRILRARGLFLANLRPGEPAVTAPYIEEAVDAAHRSGDPSTIRSALVLKGMLARELGDVSESRRILNGLEAMMADADALDRFMVRRSQSLTELLYGDLDAAERAASEAVALGDPMGPHNRTHAWDDIADVWFARGDWRNLIEIAHRTARLVQDEKASAFCRSAASIIGQGASAHALSGARDEAQALLGALPPNSDVVDRDLTSGLPRALLGFPSPETDRRLRATKHGWWEWVEAAMRAVVLRRADDAEFALQQLGPMVEGSPTVGALAAGVREAVTEMRGGAPATYAALERLGFHGWIEILKRRVDAEY